MLNKRGIELSVNFLVVLIISIAVIGFGIRFTYKLVAETSQLQKMSGQELDEKIGELLCAGDLQVCVGIERRKIPRGKVDVFGLKILNVIETTPESTFQVVIRKCRYANGNSLEDCLATSPQPLNSIPKILPVSSPSDLTPYQRIIEKLKRKEESRIAIGVEVNKGAKSGTYVLDLDVYSPPNDDLIGNPSKNRYVTTKKLYVEVP